MFINLIHLICRHIHILILVLSLDTLTFMWVFPYHTPHPLIHPPPPPPHRRWLGWESILISCHCRGCVRGVVNVYNN